MEEEDDSDDVKEIKIILLGDSGVGKTSLINRYINMYMILFVKPH